MASFTFTIKEFGKHIEVTSPVPKEKLLDFRPFKTWLATARRSLDTQNFQDHPFHDDPYKIRRIHIQAVDMFGPNRIGFMKMQVDITNDQGDWLPGAVFLRGGSVAIMMLLQPDDVPADSERENYVVLTVQPRVAAGSLAFVELPAGMLDEGTFSGTAAREIEEEIGLKIPESELFDMTAGAASQSESTTCESLQNAVYPSPGACDEYIPIFLHRKRLARKELNEMQGRLTGLRAEGERITLKLVKLEDLWKEGARDGKALAALALYTGLKAEGKI